MKIGISEDLLKYTGFIKTIEVEAKTVSEALLNTFDKYPQLYAFLICNDGVEASRTTIKLNDDYLTSAKCLWTKVCDSDRIEIGRDVPEGSGGVGKILLGAALLVGSFYMPAGFAVLTSMMAGMGASLVLSGVSSFMVGTSDLPTDGRSTSSTYTFSGIHNTTVSGTPIPIVYGRHRVGGHILNAYVDTPLSGGSSFLYSQIGISEGEIDAVETATTEINDRNAFDYDDVTVYWRGGDSDNVVGMGGVVASSSSSIDYVPVLYDMSWYTLPAFPEIGATITIGEVQDISWVDVEISRFSTYGESFVTPPLVTPIDGNSGLPIGPPTKVVLNVYGTTTTRVVTNSSFTGLLKLNFSAELTRHIGGRDRPEVTEDELRKRWAAGAYQFKWKVVSYSLFNSSLALTDSSSSMYGFNRIDYSTGYNIHVPNYVADNPNVGAIISTSTAVNTVNLLLSSPALYSNSGASGGAVKLEFYYRKIYEEHSISNPNWIRYNPTPAPSDRWDTVYSGKATKAEVTLSVNINLPDIDYYDIKIVRDIACPESDSDITVSNSVYLKNMTEIAYAELVYPCTALLGVRIKATDQLSGSMPNITSIVRGVKVSVPTGYVSRYDHVRGGGVRYQNEEWDGTLAEEKVWTDNPVWCLYDLLTNDRYGLGSEFRILESHRNVMLANFYSAAQYCDEYILEDGTLVVSRAPNKVVAEGTYASINHDGYLYQCTTGGVTSSSTVQGTTVVLNADGTVVSNNLEITDGTVVWKYIGKDKSKARFSLNIVIDEQKSASEWASTICAVMRATIYNIEGILILDIDRPKEITQLFNVSNISSFTQSSSSFKSIPNVIQTQFPNIEKEYLSDTFIIETEEYQQDQSKPQVVQALKLTGVTNEIDARRLSVYALRKLRTAKTTVSFKTGTDSLMSSVGDLIGIQHDVPMWGTGGIIESVDSSDPQYPIITLSSPYEYSTATTELDGIIVPELPNSLYGLLSVVIDYADGEEPITYSCIAPQETGRYYSVAIHAGDKTPLPGARYILSFSTNTIKPFKINSLKRSSDEFVEVTAIEYNDSVFSDDISSLGINEPQPFSSVSYGYKSSIEGFTAISSTTTYLNGQVALGVEVWYTVPTNLSWAGLSVAYAPAGSTEYKYTSVDTSGHIIINDIAASGDYVLIGRCHWKDGTMQSTSSALADTARKPFAIINLSGNTISNIFTSSSVTGLEVRGSIDGTFTGKDCKVDWRPTVIPDILLNTVASNATTGAGQGSNLLSYYEVTVTNIDGSLRRVSRTSSETYTYSHEFNVADGRVARSFYIAVTAVDISGRRNIPSILRCYNPSPPSLI